MIKPASCDPHSSAVLSIVRVTLFSGFMLTVPNISNEPNNAPFYRSVGRWARFAFHTEVVSFVRIWNLSRGGSGFRHIHMSRSNPHHV